MSGGILRGWILQQHIHSFYDIQISSFLLLRLGKLCYFRNVSIPGQFSNGFSYPWAGRAPVFLPAPAGGSAEAASFWLPALLTHALSLLLSIVLLQVYLCS